MNYSDLTITMQEVPGEISICFSICGCKLNCKGCHSSYLWNMNNGKLLSEELYRKTLKKYKNLATCILFMGGEWHEKELINYLKIAQSQNFTTCLYSGELSISNSITQHLTWIKTGPWIEELGGLDSPKTNQQFREVKTNQLLNQLFKKN
ncbi:anaerobic ribonucleoside-triphosphate reductase activating protein [Lutibacter sp. TH_r2]|uniref:anaerobic ribonucleoside-triphosphate reductase activating protein n=1 Tax=Lutibacter sp. TH_r2 TaxID=3082083 RepID=UPI0029541BE5|nr:anaerobic ribonucleoside-triphosphate reductase activating protein [Lutibacter sp. TH_r2]MDV7188153.1 anaerobic ribonucleoside-triphosphate reductase activating protein [Lutibacter sp. TH_r2]